MTVILLREVLMEMGVSFKSSESKANLIEKVTQARQMQNDTCDDNGLVTVTSTDSLNLHTEELREVPENSISSLFFHKNNALSSSSGTLLRARGKITLDTQELNVHEHLIIYFDFDLKRKIILLLHLLFLLSIMAVRCSQTSNILTLVHLLLSCSLLICFDGLALGLLCIGSPEPIERNPFNCVRLSSVSELSRIQSILSINSILREKKISASFQF